MGLRGLCSLLHMGVLEGARLPRPCVIPWNKTSDAREKDKAQSELSEFEWVSLSISESRLSR